MYEALGPVLSNIHTTYSGHGYDLSTQEQEIQY